MIQSYQNQKPALAPGALVHLSAVVIGRVSLGEKASVWPGAVLRGDLNHIQIGKGTNLQDGSVVHVDHDASVSIGEDCVVGHQACVHGCKVGNRCLIGIHSTILSHAEIGDECIIGAGAVVLEGSKIPPRSLVLGVPGKIVRQVTDEEVKGILRGAAEYRRLAQEILISHHEGMKNRK